MGSKVAESGELMTFRAALKKAHFDLMAEDDRVILIGEDVADPMGGVYKVTVGLSDAFGVERVRNTPISETAIVGTAIGSAICGYLPICEVMYFDFFTTAMDQVVNQAALLHFMSGGQIQVPIVIRCTGGAGRSSAAQHSKSLEAWFAHVPGLGVWMASTPNDAYWMLRAAVQEGNPVILNCSEMTDEDRKRIVDFASGLIFGNRGHIERVTNFVFLLSPTDVVVQEESNTSNFV